MWGTMKLKLLIITVAASLLFIFLYLSLNIKHTPSIISLRKQVPNIKIKSFDDNLLNEKIIIEFFASWCGSCLVQQNILKDFAYKHNAKLIGIMVFDDPMNFAKLMTSNHVFDYLFFDTNNLTAIEFGIDSIPKSFFINNKELLYIAAKFVNKDEIKNIEF